MSRALCFLLVQGIVFVANAQWQLSRSDRARELHSEHNDLISIDGWFDYNANSLRNELVSGLWSGSYLDRDLRERTRAVMREPTSVGYLIGARVTCGGGDSVDGHGG